MMNLRFEFVGFLIATLMLFGCEVEPAFEEYSDTLSFASCRDYFAQEFGLSNLPDSVYPQKGFEVCDSYVEDVFVTDPSFDEESYRSVVVPYLVCQDPTISLAICLDSNPHDTTSCARSADSQFQETLTKAISLHSSLSAGKEIVLDLEWFEYQMSLFDYRICPGFSGKSQKAKNFSPSKIGRE